MSVAAWKQYDNEQLARYEREQANAAFQASPSRLEARGGYTLGDTVRSSPSWWQRVGDGVAEWLDKAVEAIDGLKGAWAVRHLRFRRLLSGKISVRAETRPGTRLDYRRIVAKVMKSDPKEFLSGTRYNPKTVASRVSAGLLRRVVKGGLFSALLTFTL